MVYVEVTRQCNLRCRHCGIWKTWQGKQATGEVEASVLVGVLGGLARKGLAAVDLFGGEPLMRPDLEKIVSGLKEAGLHVTVTTNGTLLDVARAGSLLEAGVDQVLVSVDGPWQEVHDELRGRKGTLDKAVAGARAFSAAAGGAARLGFNTLVCRQNFHLLAETAALASSAGASQMRLLPYHQCYPFNQLGQDDALLPGPGELGRMKVALAHFAHKAAKLGLSTNGRTYIDGIVPWFAGKPRSAPCMAGITVCDINAFGDVYPCYTRGMPAGNIVQRPFDEIWRGDTMEELRRKTIGCRGCWQSCYIEPGLRLSPAAAARDWRALLRDVREYLG